MLADTQVVDCTKFARAIEQAHASATREWHRIPWRDRLDADYLEVYRRHLAAAMGPEGEGGDDGEDDHDLGDPVG